MNITDEQLQTYARPASDSEQSRMDNAYNTIQKVVNDHPNINESSIIIVRKGSSHNNTNVRNDADVDLTIVYQDSFFYDLPIGYDANYFGITPALKPFRDHKESVKSGVYDRFELHEIDDSKDKCTRIKPNSYRAETDVVPAWRYRKYLPSRDYHEGIAFLSDSGKLVINFPEQHTSNGTQKNNNTNRKYKRIVRIIKRLRNELRDGSNHNVPEEITSFLIESLVWNVPDEIFNSHHSYNDLLKNVIVYIYHTIENSNHGSWMEVSGILPLFSNERKWTASDVQDFLSLLWTHLGYK